MKECHKSCKTVKIKRCHENLKATKNQIQMLQILSQIMEGWGTIKFSNMNKSPIFDTLRVKGFMPYT